MNSFIDLTEPKTKSKKEKKKKNHKKHKMQVNETIFDGEKKATELKATLLNDGVELRIRAKTVVVVSVGAIRTPVLLMKSGIQVHPERGWLHVSCIY